MPRRTDIASVYRKDAPRVNATRIGDECLVLGVGLNGEFVTREKRESDRAAIDGDLPKGIAVQDKRRVGRFLSWKALTETEAAYAAMNADRDPIDISLDRTSEVIEPPGERSFRAMATPAVGPLILGVALPSARGASAAIPPSLGNVVASFPPEAQAA